MEARHPHFFAVLQIQIMTTFPIPKDYQAPDGTKEGDTFKEIATFSFEGGNMNLHSIGEKDAPLEGSKDKKTKPKGMAATIKAKLDSTGEKD